MQYDGMLAVSVRFRNCIVSRMSDVQIDSYEIVDGWFSIEMKEFVCGGFKEMPPATLKAEPTEGLKDHPAIQPKPYEFDESKLIELDPIDDEMLEETDNIIKILNDLF